MSDTPDPQNNPSDWDEDRLWAELRAKTLDAKPDLIWKVSQPALFKNITAFENEGRLKYAAAAIFLVLFGSGALIVRLRERAAARAMTAVAEPTHYSTARAQYATIRLTDSSQVTLAPESRLTIPSNFGQGVREISLDGEAIFSVRHDSSRPFRIRANGAVIEDIGTRFDLRAYANETTVSVAVAEGSVTLGQDRADSSPHRAAGTQGVVLRRGDVGSLSKMGLVSTTRTTRVENMLAWANGRLSFAGQPLPEVLRSIGRWYDIDVRVPNAQLSGRLVTAEFSTQSPSEMIDALAIALDATVERAGRIYTLRPR